MAGSRSRVLDILKIGLGIELEAHQVIAQLGVAFQAIQPLASANRIASPVASSLASSSAKTRSHVPWTRLRLRLEFRRLGKHFPGEFCPSAFA